MIHISELYTLYQKHPAVYTDTRNPIQGGIYFALKGEHFNGNLFAENALEAGAAFAVVDDESVAVNDRMLLVADVLKSLQELARYHRRQLKMKVIGITGSNGKTTTKELVSAVLSRKYNTHFTQGNLNNHIGVPLTLLSMSPKSDIAVIEMGASHPGDIHELCEIAEPDFGLITNIGKAHLEGMGGYSGVLETKTELYRFIEKINGLVFVNSNHVDFVERSENIRRFTFGDKDSNDLVGVFIDSAPYVRLKWKSEKRLSWDECGLIQTHLMGYYNYENILAAIAIGKYFDVNANDITNAVSEYEPKNNRSQIVDTGKNLLIMDAYNANPTSMEAAIKNFSSLPASKKMLILGKMMELGQTSADEHARIARMACDVEAARVILVGDLFENKPETASWFLNTDDLFNYLKTNPLSGYTILIKGSRSNQLERIKVLL